MLVGIHLGRGNSCLFGVGIPPYHFYISQRFHGRRPRVKYPSWIQNVAFGAEQMVVVVVVVVVVERPSKVHSLNKVEVGLLLEEHVMATMVDFVAEE